MTVRRVLVMLAVFGLALAACGGGGADDPTDTTVLVVQDGRVVEGEIVYQSTCRNCHGSKLEGVSGLGKPLAPSEFVVVNTEEELAAFIKVGRSARDPINTQGVDMPPFGGKPWFNDQDLRDVAAYIKSLN